jgi:hypothetical protein
MVDLEKSTEAISSGYQPSPLDLAAQNKLVTDYDQRALAAEATNSRQAAETGLIGKKEDEETSCFRGSLD